MILIAGDSWTLGELSYGNILHHGFAEYIRTETDHAVLNLGVGHGSNADTVRTIDYFLHANPNFDISRIFVFQTDYMRCVRETDGRSFKSLKDHYICKFYYKLSELATKFNIPIYIIGGLSDTIWLDKFDVEYPGLQIVCQSWVNLLLTGNHNIDIPISSVYQKVTEPMVNEVKRNSTDRELTALMNDLTLADQRLATFRDNKNWFYPDGVHPNRAGHRVLFEFLRDKQYF